MELPNFANMFQLATGIQQANNAFNVTQAQNLRSWQEQQNAKAMAFNRDEAAKNRAWQEFMSNTAHQREIADLKAAGLNPVLSAQGGNGASVGSGATASGVSSSGASANADVSLSSVIASIFGSMLQTQTQLEAANINARTQEAIADKTTAMQELVALLTTGSNEKIAGINAYNSRYLAQYNGAIQKQLLEIANAHDIYMAQHYPTNKYGFIGSLINQVQSLFAHDPTTQDIIAQASGKDTAYAVNYREKASALASKIEAYDRKANEPGISIKEKQHYMYVRDEARKELSQMVS